MTDHLVFWLWLTQIKGIGYKTSKRLLEALGDPQAVYEAPKGELMAVSGVGQALADSIRDHRSLAAARDALALAIKHEVKILTLHHEHYPAQLNNLPDAPAVLYYRGTIPSNGGVLIVSRPCTSLW